MPSRRFLFILSSGRRGGNSEQLARQAAAALPVSFEQKWLSLLDCPLAPFEDKRPPSAGYGLPVSAEKTLLDATLWATDVVVVSPVYWYALSASAKLYLDHWSAWLRAPGIDFRQKMASKTLWAVCSNSAETVEESKTTAALLVECLRLSADYMKMVYGGALVGMGNRPGDVLHDVAAMAAARHFFEAVGQGRS